MKAPPPVTGSVIPSIEKLRSRVKAAKEEFELAMAFHETWKPTAYDTDLQARMGTSFATHTFRVIRQSLRRELLMALSRLWDNDPKAIGMQTIQKALKDKRLVALLAVEREKHWLFQAIDLPDVPAEHLEEFVEMFRRDNRERAEEDVAALHDQIREVLDLIGGYNVNGPKYSVRLLVKGLRDERLAHRQIVAEKSNSFPAMDAAVEAFYQDMQQIIILLIQIAEHTRYMIEAIGDAHRDAAALFWIAVCGERTPGHPNYRERNSGD